MLSALSWGGIALMAQLELHYVERERRFTLVAAVVHIYQHVPVRPSYLCTAAFELVALARFKLPVYAVYAAVTVAYAAAPTLGHR